jgi:hypothetical protein
MSHFSGHFEGASTFLTPKLSLAQSLEMAHKVIVPQKKNYVPQFLKQRDINSYYLPHVIFIIIVIILAKGALFHA